MGSQSTLFKDSPLRTLKRKSSNMKRLSPAPQLGPSSDAHTSYYSESVVRESYFGSPRASSLARSSILDDHLHGDSYWSEDLRVRRRRGTGGTESSKLNGLAENKSSEDFLGSSSGYSSEDDFAGYSETDHRDSGSRLRNAVSWAASCFWTLVTSPGRLFGLLYWWVGTTWYRLTTAASLLDVFVLTRRFSSVKTFLWFLLLLLLMTGLTYGAWYFYPYGLQTFHPAVVSWWAAKSSGRQQDVCESRDLSHFQAEQRILSQVHSLERRLEALAAEFSSNWQKEAIRLERLELRQGAAGGGGHVGLSQDDTLALLEGLVSRREAALKEDFRRDTAARIQVSEQERSGVWVARWVYGMEGQGPAHPDMTETAVCHLAVTFSKPSFPVKWRLSCLPLHPHPVVRAQDCRVPGTRGVQLDPGSLACSQGALEKKGQELKFAVRQAWFKFPSDPVLAKFPLPVTPESPQPLSSDRKNWSP